MVRNLYGASFLLRERGPGMIIDIYTHIYPPEAVEARSRVDWKPPR